MPMFYFHTEDGAFYKDEHGADCADLKAASAAALQVLAEHLESRPKDFWAHDCLQIHLADERGLRLLTLSVTAIFSAAIANRPQIARPE